jgi:FkbM family methyltransferase
MTPTASFNYRDRSYVITGYDDGDYILGKIRERETFFEKDVLEFIARRRLRGIYVDVGANIGNHTLFFLTQTKSEHVIAVEGNADVVPVLKSNLRRNVANSDSYTVLEYFLSNHERVFFNRGRSGNVGSSFVTSVQLGLDSSPVSTYRLDEIVDRKRKVSLLKLDVEGHELEVLDSGREILTTHQPEVCAEVISTTSAEITAYLCRYGYLPLMAFPEGNWYYIVFPRWLIFIVQILANLPDVISTRTCWRMIRIFALLSGRLSPSLYSSHIPTYGRELLPRR